MGKVSIIESDLTRCIICGASPVQLHHTHGGINRKHADEYGLIVPLCLEHHTGTREPTTAGRLTCISSD